MIILVFLLLIIQIATFLWLVLIFVSGTQSAIAGAPYVPISKKLVKPLLEFAQIRAGEVVYDLGCGDARILLASAAYPNVRCVGYEIAFWPYLQSQWKIWRRNAADQVRVVRGSCFKADTASASLVYLYLFPKLVDKLAYKLAQETKPGTRVLCPSFPIDLIRHPEFRLIKSEKIGSIIAYLHERI